MNADAGVGRGRMGEPAPHSDIVFDCVSLGFHSFFDFVFKVSAKIIDDECIGAFICKPERSIALLN